MTTPAEPSRRTRVIALIVVFGLVAVGAGFGIKALVDVANTRPAATPSATPTPTSTGAGFDYTSDAFGYTIEFPAEPTEQSKTVQTEKGDVQSTTAYWTDGTVTLAVNGAAYPEGALGDVEGSLKSSLTTAIDGISGARLVSSDPTTIDGIPGVSANIFIPDGTLRIIIAIDGDTQYQLVAQNAGPTVAQGFFTSFHQG